MALTDDQRAMLRLLAQNDESYEDIAALKGVGVEQVRAEVKAALAAAAQEPSAPEPVAQPPKAAKPPSAKPAAGQGVPRPSPEARPKTSPKPRAPRKARAAVPPERRRLLLMTAGAVALVAVALTAIALIGGSGGSGSTASEGGSATLAENPSAANGKLTQAELKSVDGSDAKGQAVFGRLQKKIVLLVEAVNLKPSPKGSSYTIWLYKSPKLAVRVASVKVSKSGGIRVPVQLTPEIFAAVLARVFDRINVSRTEDAAYEREVARAKTKNKLPPYTGETVLSGEVTGPVPKKSGKQGG
jgi:hypothetical protein